MNEGTIASADYKFDKNGRKYPAKRIHMGEKEKQQVTEASYKGNIGVMELAKFHSSASTADKEHFTRLMKKKSEAKTDKEQQQMASQIWDHIQKTTGTKLHQMESTMVPFSTMLESKDDFILQTLADRDINASIKDGKVVVHDHTQHAKAKSMVKRMGMPHEVVKGMKEDLDESFDWHKHNGDWDKAKKAGKELFDGEMAKAKVKTDAALKLKTKAWEEHKKGSYIGAVVRGHVEDYFDRQLRDDVNVDDTATVVQEAMPTHEFNKLVRGYLTHKKAAKAGNFKPMTMDQYKRHSVKALSVKEETIEELSNKTLDTYTKKAAGKEKSGREWQRMSGLIRANMKKKDKVNEDQKVVVPVPKPRNPNQGILANKKNAAGMHVDKKKKLKMGVDKHKNRVFEETNDE